MSCNGKPHQKRINRMEAVRMLFLEGKTKKEAALILKINPETVGSYCRRDSSLRDLYQSTEEKRKKLIEGEKLRNSGLIFCREELAHDILTGLSAQQLFFKFGFDPRSIIRFFLDVDPELAERLKQNGIDACRSRKNRASKEELEYRKQYILSHKEELEAIGKKSFIVRQIAGDLQINPSIVDVFCRTTPGLSEWWLSFRTRDGIRSKSRMSIDKWKLLSANRCISTNGFSDKRKIKGRQRREAEINKIKELIGFGLYQREIAKCMDYTKKTILNRMEEFPDLSQAYKEAKGLRKSRKNNRSNSSGV